MMPAVPRRSRLLGSVVFLLGLVLFLVEHRPLPFIVVSVFFFYSISINIGRAPTITVVPHQGSSAPVCAIGGWGQRGRRRKSEGV